MADLVIGKGCYLLFGVDKVHYLQFGILIFIFFKPLSKVLKNDGARIVLLLSPSLIFFLRILRNAPFFLSDDFAHLALVSDNSYLEIARLALLPQGIWVGHRIVTAFWLFKGIFDTFGTNIEPYVFVVFLLNVVNVLLLYKLTETVSKNKILGAVAAFLFSFNYLSWISNLHELLGTACMLGTLLAWQAYLNTKKKGWFIASIVLYVSAVFSKEITFLIPFALLVFCQIREKSFLKINTKLLKPVVLFFSIMVGYYLIFTSGFLAYFGIGDSGGYGMGFDLRIILTNLMYYLRQLIPGVDPKFTLVILLGFIGLADYLRKRAIALPFFGLFLLFIFPPLLFIDRTAFYYIYIPSTFLYMSLVFACESYFLASAKIKMTVFVRRFILSFVTASVLFGILRIGKRFMDECFLIQFPWQNAKVLTLKVLEDRLNRQLVISRSFPTTLDLTDNEKDKLADILQNNLLDEFLDHNNNLLFSYSQGRVTIDKDVQ